MGRISREVMFMEMAKAAARRSTCFRLNVGALVVYGNNPISIGYNGQTSGAPHCPGNDCPGVVPGKCNTLHAERNALLKAQDLLSFPTAEVDLYVTNSPCQACCELIQVSWVSVKRLFFEVPYRDTSCLGMLRGSTEVYEITPAGYIVDYFTRQVIELP